MTSGQFLKGLNSFSGILISMAQKITDSGEIKLYIVQLFSELTGGASERKIKIYMDNLNCSDYAEILKTEINEGRIKKSGKKTDVYTLSESIPSDIVENVKKEKPVLAIIGQDELTLEQIFERTKDKKKDEIEAELNECVDKGYVKKEQAELFEGNYQMPLVSLVKETLEKRGEIKDGKGLISKVIKKAELPERRGKD